MSDRSTISRKEDEIRELLKPGNGAMLTARREADFTDRRGARSVLYRLLSDSLAAIRSRASFQSRSTERMDRPDASAVSSVVSPAK